MTGDTNTFHPGQRAVVAGRAEITCSSEPDLYVDAPPYCDQLAVRQRVPATLTASGRQVLDSFAPTPQ